MGILALACVGVLLVASLEYGSHSVQATRYEVFYLPLEAEFYVPPTREYITKYGTHLCTESKAVALIFDVTSRSDGELASSDDQSGLRILLRQETSGREIFITSDRNVVAGQRRYVVDNEVLATIISEVVSLAAEKERP